MAFMSINDPEFWKNCPDELKHVQEGRGAGAAAYFLMGDRKDNPPTVVALKLPPHGVLPRHAHDCHRFEIIVQGSINVGERILTVGDVMVSPPNTLYGPHIAGPEGCTTFEIFSNHKASYSPIVELEEGMVQFDVGSRAGHQRMRDLVREHESRTVEAKA